MALDSNRVRFPSTSCSVDRLCVCACVHVCGHHGDVRPMTEGLAQLLSNRPVMFHLFSLHRVYLLIERERLGITGQAQELPTGALKAKCQTRMFALAK